MNWTVLNLVLVPVTFAVGWLLGRVSVMRGKLDRAMERLDIMERAVHGVMIMEDPMRPITTEKAAEIRLAIEKFLDTSPPLQIKPSPSKFDA